MIKLAYNNNNNRYVKIDISSILINKLTIKKKKWEF